MRDQNFQHTTQYKPPFPWFGGKALVASVVWRALGDVQNYVEPFFGSGAVLFLRPGGAHGLETVNDADGFVSNFWRALQADPEAVAGHADWPVNEADLHARHLWLVDRRESITDRLCGDPGFFDAQAAGWWVWGLCCWIGGGWCSGKGPWMSDGEILVRGATNRGVTRKIPHLGDTGKGVNRRRPNLGDAGKGVNRRRPHLGNAGQGVNRPDPGACAERRANLVAYMCRLADRLRGVRVCCGDWSRVCGPSVTVKHGVTGVFLDPPYPGNAGRDMELYATESADAAHASRAWAEEWGAHPDLRIVLAGYEGGKPMPKGWREHRWKARGGYASQGDGRGRENRTRERLWSSPACVPAAQGRLPL